MSRQKKGNTLNINGKTLVFKESDIKLFRKLENAANNLGRAFQKSGKITGEEVLANMIESCLSIMLILHEILSSTLDLGRHSVRRVTDISYTVERNLLDAFLVAGAAARAQPWLAWEIMTQYNSIALHHGRMMKRLNGAIVSALRKAVCTLEGRKEGIKNLGDYLTEIAVFSLQVEENIHILLDNSDLLRLEEHQVSQLHQMLGRVKTLLKWKRPRPQS